MKRTRESEEVFVFRRLTVGEGSQGKAGERSCGGILNRGRVSQEMECSPLEATITNTITIRTRNKESEREGEGYMMLLRMGAWLAFI